MEYENLGVEDNNTINEKLLRRKSSFDDPRKQRSLSMMMERIDGNNKEKVPDILLIMNFLEERHGNTKLKIKPLFIQLLTILIKFLIINPYSHSKNDK